MIRINKRFRIGKSVCLFDGDDYRLSHENKGKGFLFEVKTDERLFLKVKSFLSNKSEDVMMFTSNRGKKYIFSSQNLRVPMAIHRGGRGFENQLAVYSGGG
ncbi:MAG: hypothetical protein J6Q59_05775 [Paludibacteraceae bacterium]|nr:hypothetical protein [Paludibacteraceae bacterium]